MTRMGTCGLFVIVTVFIREIPVVPAGDIYEGRGIRRVEIKGEILEGEVW